MKCPVCTTSNLVMADRQGIEIDYCPDCRGVWLDRGELDKIIERSSAVVPPADPRVDPRRPPESRPYADDRYAGSHPGHHAGSHSGYHKKHKRGGLLSELFDF